MRHLTLISFGLALATTAGAQTVKTIRNNGKLSNRYDIVILGDGYRSSEQNKFDTDAQAVATKLFATEPYRTYQKFFNIHTVFRASQQSGADHPDRNPPVFRNTVYNATYNFGGTGRCLYIQNTTQALRDAALAPAVEGRVMVLVNDSRYGGCAGQFSVSYNGTQMGDVQVHEFGHSFGGLADEYFSSGCYTGNEPVEKNVTKDASGRLKWARWLGSNGIGAVQGARYFRCGLYRPATDCIMRTLGQPHCAVCGEQVVLSAYRTVSSIDCPIPPAPAATIIQGPKLVYGFTNIAPHPSQLLWRIDGVPQPVNVPQLVVDTTRLALGPHVITAEVFDRTPRVRTDPTGQLRKRHSWQLRLQPPPLPDLVPVRIQGSITRAGQQAGIATVIQNQGGLPAAAVHVEHYLSIDTVISADDTYLGGYPQGPLGPGQQMPGHRTDVRIPAHIPPGRYHLAAVVDRANVVRESNEGNNLLWGHIDIDHAGCIQALSYQDPQIYPATAHSIPARTGGRAHPVVTAPCQPGDMYIILLGCTGTSPGTQIRLGLTLPLNLDPCSDVFFRAARLNTPVVQGFLGTLDPSGYGRATIRLPPGAVTATLGGHFAAVILDRSSGFIVQTTNPIRFDIR